MPGKREEMPLIPMRGIVIFPYMVLHIDVAREKSIAALEAAMEGDRLVFLTSQKDASVESPSVEELYTIGTVVRVKQLLKLPKGFVRVMVEGLYRAELVAAEEDRFINCTVQKVQADRFALTAADMEAAMRMADRLLLEYLELSPRVSRDIYAKISANRDLGRYTDAIAAEILLRTEDRQKILEEKNLLLRVEKLISILQNEIAVLSSEREIAAKVQENFALQRRENILREQMRVIAHELGDDLESDIAAFQEKIKTKPFPDEVRKKAEKELARLARFPSASAEANTIYNYLEQLLGMPYGVRSEENTDIARAKAILERDHYGLERVKERILEYLAVRTLAGSVSGQILCLVGPPGVGKTSIAKSVAEALGRKYVRIALGGVHDEAEIRGHRKTYIGAMPGRIADAIRHAGTENPLVLLDEIDKLGTDYKGDPTAALLEVLDPAQNSSFRDHFLEVPFSLSDVMFITTANAADRIPRPLYDRMEIIEIPGYTEAEKTEIAMRHLWPRNVKKHGLTGKKVRIRRDVIAEIITHYTKEAGVRGLERELAHALRRAAKEIVGGKEQVVFTKNNLTRYLGVYKFLQDTIEKEPTIGVACGLAWTAVGGETLQIEVNAMEGDGKVQLTGKLGDVMKESAAAAISYIRTRTKELGIPLDFYKTQDLHVHVPEGAVPKDGPSAGITIATAIASALSGRAVRGDLAMTGEITLRGRVLPIGGVKEKLLAAHRYGKTTVLLPLDNKKDLEDIPQDVLDKMEIIFADNMDTVLSTALLPLLEENEDIPLFEKTVENIGIMQ